MEDFKYDTKSKASMTAHALVYIFKLQQSKLEYKGINDNVINYSKFIKNGKNDITYIDRCKLYENKRKYYYFSDSVREKMSQTCDNSFNTKTKLLDLYKFDKNAQCQWLSYLMDAEKTGVIRPSYDLWTKILWFLPFEYVLVLFHYYEVSCEKAQQEKKRIFKQAERDASSNAKSSLYDMQRGNSLVLNLININLADDVAYICSQLLPLIDNEVDELLKPYAKYTEPIERVKVPFKEIEKNENQEELKIISKKLEILNNPVDDWEDFAV